MGEGTKLPRPRIIQFENEVVVQGETRQGDPVETRISNDDLMDLMYLAATHPKYPGVPPEPKSYLIDSSVPDKEVAGLLNARRIINIRAIELSQMLLLDLLRADGSREMVSLGRDEVRNLHDRMVEQMKHFGFPPFPST